MNWRKECKKATRQIDIKYKHYCTKIQYKPGHAAQGKFLRPYLKVHLLSTHMHNGMCIQDSLCENYSTHMQRESGHIKLSAGNIPAL